MWYLFLQHDIIYLSLIFHLVAKWGTDTGQKEVDHFHPGLIIKNPSSMILKVNNIVTTAVSKILLCARINLWFFQHFVVLQKVCYYLNYKLMSLKQIQKSQALLSYDAFVIVNSRKRIRRCPAAGIFDNQSAPDFGKLTKTWLSESPENNLSLYTINPFYSQLLFISAVCHLMLWSALVQTAFFLSV